MAAGAGGLLLPALAFAVATSATPGPNNMMVAASGANFGFRRTLPHMLGVAVGFPVMLVALALGAGEVVRTWPGIERGMRFAGAAYLLWLAWRIGSAPPKLAVARGAGRPLGFLQAAMFQWVNPKAWVIAVGAVVTFTSGGGAVLAQSLALAALFLVASLSSVAFWTGVGAGAGRLLRRSAALRAFNVAMALLLVASLVPLFAEGR